MKTHIEQIHEGTKSVLNEEEKLCKCSICNKEFTKESNLKRHISSVHERTKPYQCTSCGTEFSDPDSLKSHLLSVHEIEKVDKWQWKCSICNKEFGKEYNLKRHIASVHEKKKPYQCSLCGSEFSELPKLKRHLAMHGYCPIVGTTGMWEHETRQTKFCVCVNDFGIKYFNKDDADHLLTSLQNYFPTM